jgi:phospholipid/cholesterol/gamma-HCH transport system substrate-binding protein
MSSEKRDLPMAMRDTEIKVGLIVTAAALIFLFSLVWVKDYSLNHHRYELTVIFPTVGGLAAGDPVHVAGVKKGEVKQVWLRATDVWVTISLEGEIQLLEGSRISIQSMGLMGEKFVAIEPGRGTKGISPDHPIMGHYQAGIPEVMGEVGDVLGLLKELANSIHKTVGNSEAQASIRESLENIRKFSEALAHLLDQQEGDLAVALSDLRSASTGFRELVEGNRSRVDSTIDQFHRASMDLEMLTKQLSELSATFTKIADKIERGEGTLGAVVQDEALYRDIKKTVQSLDELILDIKEHPKRYVHLELF